MKKKITMINPLVARVNKEILTKYKKNVTQVIKYARQAATGFINNLIDEMTKATKAGTGNNVTEFISKYIDACIGFWPGKDAKFKKLSTRACDFVKSLDMPSTNLIDDFMNYIEELPKFYEEFLELPNSHIYLIRIGNVLIIFTIDDANDGKRWVHHASFTLDYIMKFFKDYNKYEDRTNCDSLSIVINLWMAEKLNVIVMNEAEPKESVKSSQTICNEIGLNPTPFAYKYVHITDSTWSKYEKAITATTSRNDAEYKVPSWLVRAHFRKYQNKIVLIKAHYAYRKCGEVKDTELIDLYV